MKSITTLIITTFVSFCAFAGPEGGTGPLLMASGIHADWFDSSTTAKPSAGISWTYTATAEQVNQAIAFAAADLSSGDANLEAELYNSYNPRFATAIIQANPQLDLYEPVARVRAIAKFTTGVSYLDGAQLVDGAEAVKAISAQGELVESMPTVNLIDMFEAAMEANQWK